MTLDELVDDADRPSVAVAAPGLNPRELEAIGFIVDGYTVGQIAARLGIHASNVSRRLSNAAAALGCNTYAQAAVEAVRRGLLGPDTQRAHRIRRELADRHTSRCALLRPATCDCQTGAAP